MSHNRIRYYIFIIFLFFLIPAYGERHIVSKGETVNSIASKYGIKSKDIISKNPSAKRYIYPGMELIIPDKEYEFKMLFKKGELEFARQNYSKSIKSFKKALKKKNDEMARYNIAVAYYKRGDYKKASEWGHSAAKYAKSDEIKEKAGSIVKKTSKILNARDEERRAQSREFWGNVANSMATAMQNNSYPPQYYQHTPYINGYSGYSNYSPIITTPQSLNPNVYFQNHKEQIERQVEEEREHFKEAYSVYFKLQNGREPTEQEVNAAYYQAMTSSSNTTEDSSYGNELRERNKIRDDENKRQRQVRMEGYRSEYGQKDCPFCGGSGECQTCHGSASISSQFGLSDMKCPNCEHGHPGKCSHCHGTGKIFGKL